MASNPTQNLPGQNQADWAVIFQSVPSKTKKNVIKSLEENFDLESEDAAQVLSNMPLLLLDNVFSEEAKQVKEFFQESGVVVEITNHQMIKKNCFQIVWPERPDLAIFFKKKIKENLPVEPIAELVKENNESKEAIVPPAENILNTIEKDDEWERRTRELNEKLKLFQEGKNLASSKKDEDIETEAEDVQINKTENEEFAGSSPVDLPVSAAEEAKNASEAEWQYKIDFLNGKLSQLEKTVYEKDEAIVNLNREKEALSNKIQELTQRENAVSEHAAYAGDDDASRKRISELEEAIKNSDFEKNELKNKLKSVEENFAGATRENESRQSRILQLEQETRGFDEQKAKFETRIQELEKNIENAKREFDAVSLREKEWILKASGLEKTLGGMEESLKSRDAALSLFEKQILELAQKLQAAEAVKKEHAQLVQERATIKQEYHAQLADQESRLAKLEDEHRRYKSRADRKTAAATRELGEWIRIVDTVRQGLQKLIMFLGSESAVLDTDKKSLPRTSFQRGKDSMQL